MKISGKYSYHHLSQHRNFLYALNFVILINRSTFPLVTASLHELEYINNKTEDRRIS